VLAEQAARTLQSADLILGSIKERIEVLQESDRADLPAIHRMLTERIAGAPQIKQVTVLDRRGNAIVSSRSDPALGLWLGDRPYFTVHRDRPDAGLFISDPVRRRADGEWLIFISRRLEAADGSFAGVVSVGLDPAYFESVYKAAVANDEASIVLFRDDGTVLAGYPRRDDWFGRRLVDASTFRRLIALAAGSDLRMVGMTEGEPRLYAPQNVPGDPLVIIPSLREAQALAGWRSEASLIAIIAAAASIAMLALFMSLRAREIQARRHAVLLQDAVDALGDGFVLYDADDRFVMCNQRFREIRSDNPLSQQPGAHFGDILRSAVACGEAPVPEQGIEAWAGSGFRIDAHVTAALSPSTRTSPS
jgi:PAS domain-containing protein